MFKRFAPWIAYLLGILTGSIADVDLSLAMILFWLTGLVLSVVFTITDKRAGKARIEYVIGIVVGVLGIVVYIAWAIFAMIFVTSLFFDMFKY